MQSSSILCHLDRNIYTRLRLARPWSKQMPGSQFLRKLYGKRQKKCVKGFCKQKFFDVRWISTTQRMEANCLSLYSLLRTKFILHSIYTSHNSFVVQFFLHCNGLYAYWFVLFAFICYNCLFQLQNAYLHPRPAWDRVKQKLPLVSTLKQWWRSQGSKSSPRRPAVIAPAPVAAEAYPKTNSLDFGSSISE